MKRFYTFIAEVEDVVESLEGELLIVSSNSEGSEVVGGGHRDVAIEGGEELGREPLVGRHMKPHKGGEPGVVRHPREVGSETILVEKLVTHRPRGSEFTPTQHHEHLIIVAFPDHGLGVLSRPLSTMPIVEPPAAYLPLSAFFQKRIAMSTNFERISLGK